MREFYSFTLKINRIRSLQKPLFYCLDFRKWHEIIWKKCTCLLLDLENLNPSKTFSSKYCTKHCYGFGISTWIFSQKILRPYRNLFPLRKSLSKTLHSRYDCIHIFPVVSHIYWFLDCPQSWTENIFLLCKSLFK